MAKETRSTLGKALSRLFSSNIVVRNLGGNQLKIVDPSNIQSVASKYYETKYKGLHSYNEGGRAHRQHQQAPGSNIGYLSERTGLYRDYETMDTDAIISAALDMYADEACAENEYGNVLTIDAGDQEIKDILHNLFYEILDIEFNLRWWVRTLTKYGDCYLKLSISDEYGVVSAEPMSPFEVERMERTDSDDPYSVTFKHKGFSNQPEYEFWQVAHFRLLSDGNYLPYGKCLAPETKVSTEFGERSICNIEPGDSVWTYDYENEKFELSTVKNTKCSGEKELIKISTKYNYVRCSKNHPVLVVDKETREYCYKKAANLLVGDLLVQSDNQETGSFGGVEGKDAALSPVKSVRKSGKEDVWDIQVNSNNNNFVANRTVVHNSVLEGARRTWKQLCLHEQSRIKTADGPKKIKNVTSEDKVYSFDPESGDLVKTSVKACMEMGSQDTYTVSTKTRQIRATDRHGLLVFNKDKNFHYKAVENLQTGTDKLIVPKDGGSHELQNIRSVELFEENSKTYDLEVENDLHNFVADGVVSHNTLLEDAMLVHRIMRAPEKRIFRIDVGNIEPDAVDTFMDQIVQEINKTPLIDPETGEYNLKYNMQNMIEDYYLPVRGDESGTEIDTLSGLEYQAIEDVEYLRKKMMTALRIPNAFLGYEKELEGKCLHPDTRIELLSGESMRVEDIAVEYETDEDSLWTYSYDFEENRVVPGKIVEAEKTRENVEIVEVVLDNGETVKTTPDHDFILQDGTEVEAQNLEEGDSLRTIERRKKELGNNTCEYEQVWQPEEEKWEWTHKMVDRYFNGEIERNGYSEDGRFSYDNLTVVHHEDFDRYNNSPNNLRRMNFKDHRELHNENLSDEWYEWQDKRAELNKTEEYREWASKRAKRWMEENPENKYNIRDVWLSLSPEERSEIVADGWNEERKKKQAERARENSRAQQMLEAKRENNFESTLEGEDHPRHRKRPSFDEIVEFVENYEGDPEDVSTIWNLEDSFGLTKYILQEVIEENGYNCTQFMNEFWGFKRGRPKDLHPETFIDLSASCEDMEEFVDRIDAYSKRTAKSIVENNGFEFEEWKENILGSRYNHKVVEVNELEEKVDTYNIEVEDKNNNHNFLTATGLTLKNSTLSQQSIKFANQVKYIQKIVVSELKKIAMIHLFSLGIRDQRLVQFDLSLTSPSTVQESEYLDLLSQKVDLARTITELPLFSTDWIYKKLFNLSDDEIERQRDLKKDDWKRQFQQDQITREGNDPVKTGQSFGTPHDLAQSGSANIKPLDLEKKEKEKQKNKAVKNMQKSKQNKLGGDPLGKDKAFDNSNLRTGDPDYEQRYRDRRGLPVDHFLPGKKKDLIKESLSSIEDADKIEEAIENIDAAGGVSKEDLSDYEKGTFMDESVLDHSV